MSHSQLALPPLCLYVHIPWCLKKCPYCDFNSHEQGEFLPEDEYIGQLLKDLSLDRGLAQGRSCDAVFIGGGTPSLFSATGLARLLTGIDNIIPLAGDAEITLEANPGTFEQNRFRDFHRAGINRLSLGIQSFNPVHLEKLGRVHGREEALRAAGLARESGFGNINLDLMFGLPGQTMAEAMADLDAAIALAPDHLSWYQLTIEPNTVFYRQPPELPADDTTGNMQEQGIDKLAGAGYARYEISAYSRPQRRSVHNSNYWTFGDYLGIGAGAHGKVTLAEENTILRTRKVRIPRTYLACEDNFTAEQYPVNQDDLPLEFMMNALRLVEGVDPALFSARTGLHLSSIAPELDALRVEALLAPDRLRATPRGLMFLNDVLSRFLPDEALQGRLKVLQQ